MSPYALQDWLATHTAVYATSRLQLQWPTAPFAAIRFGWTVFSGDEDYKNPAYSGVPLEFFRDNARIQLRGWFNYAASLGLARGPFQLEVAYITYRSTRRVRETARTAEEQTRVTDIKTRYSNLSIQIGYTIRVSR